MRKLIESGKDTNLKSGRDFSGANTIQSTQISLAQIPATSNGLLFKNKIIIIYQNSFLLNGTLQNIEINDVIESKLQYNCKTVVYILLDDKDPFFILGFLYP